MAQGNPQARNELPVLLGTKWLLDRVGVCVNVHPRRFATKLIARDNNTNEAGSGTVSCADTTLLRSMP